MGCWNQTCGITQIHIREGEKVMVVPLVKANGEASLCYTTSFWSPFAVPFYAEYNDYGAGENDEGIGLPLVLADITNSLVEQDQGENVYHDIPVKADRFNIELFWEAIHEQRLFVKTWKEPEQVSMVMIKMSVLKHLMASREFETYDYTKSTSKITYYKYKFQEVMDGVPELVDILFSRPLPDGVDESTLEEGELEFLKRTTFMFDPLKKAAGKLLGTWEEPVSRKDCNRAALWLQYSPSHLAYSSFSNEAMVNAALSDYADADDRDGAIAFLQEHLKVRFIDNLFLETRKHWIPQAGAGSQSDSHDGYRAIIAAMTHVLDEEQAERE